MLKAFLPLSLQIGEGTAALQRWRHLTVRDLRTKAPLNLELLPEVQLAAHAGLNYKVCVLLPPTPYLENVTPVESNSTQLEKFRLHVQPDISGKYTVLRGFQESGERASPPLSGLDNTPQCVQFFTVSQGLDIKTLPKAIIRVRFYTPLYSDSIKVILP